jgi:peptidyl-prolyl cis-trans isomerase C
MRRFFLPLFALTLALSGCGKKGNVLASVDGKDVTQAEFDAYLKNKHVSAADAARRDRAFQDYLDRSALSAVIEKEKLLDKQDIDAECSSAATSIASWTRR